MQKSEYHQTKETNCFQQLQILYTHQDNLSIWSHLTKAYDPILTKPRTNHHYLYHITQGECFTQFITIHDTIHVFTCTKMHTQLNSRVIIQLLDTWNDDLNILGLLDGHFNTQLEMGKKTSIYFYIDFCSWIWNREISWSLTCYGWCETCWSRS